MAEEVQVEDIVEDEEDEDEPIISQRHGEWVSQDHASDGNEEERRSSRKAPSTTASSRRDRPVSPSSLHDASTFHFRASQGHHHDDASASQQQQQHSLQDRLTASALSGTYDLLKFASGVTLSTTGKIVQPPLHLARMLLPALSAALQDYLATVTPDRLQAWSRIVSSSVHHVWIVLKDTEQGSQFRNALGTVWTDVLGVVSAASTRQVLVEAMSTVVRAAQAMDTPECFALLDQVAVLLCRITSNTNNSGRHQELWHDVGTACQRGIRLASDPHTTLALAEVTAYLCYALEREEANWKESHDAQRNGSLAEAATARRIRQDRQSKTHLQRQVLEENASSVDPAFTTTIEEAILSSLGMTENTNHASGRQEQQCEDDAATTTSSFVPSRTGDLASTVSHEEAASRETQGETLTDDDLLHVQARKDVNVDLLRRRILEQPPTSRNTQPVWQSLDGTEAMKATGPSQDDDDHAVEDSADAVAAEESQGQSQPTASPKRPRVRVQQDCSNKDPSDSNEDALRADDSDWLHPPHAMPHAQESAVQHFYRILDQALEQKRQEGVYATVKQRSGVIETPSRTTQLGGRVTTTRKRQTATTTTAGGPSGIQTSTSRGTSLKDRLEDIRSDVLSQLRKEDREKLVNIEELVFRNKRAVKLTLTGIVVAILLGAMTVFGFAGYGAYVYWFPSRHTRLDHSAPGTQEVVIRIVREVVHVTPDGKKVSNDDMEQQEGLVGVSEESLNQIGSCVADAIEAME